MCACVLVMHRNHRNSTAAAPQIGNSTKQVNKVKPNVNRSATDNVLSPGYTPRYWSGGGAYEPLLPPLTAPQHAPTSCPQSVRPQPTTTNRAVVLFSSNNFAMSCCICCFTDRRSRKLRVTRVITLPMKSRNSCTLQLYLTLFTVTLLNNNALFAAGLFAYCLCCRHFCSILFYVVTLCCAMLLFLSLFYIAMVPVFLLIFFSFFFIV